MDDFVNCKVAQLVARKSATFHGKRPRYLVTTADARYQLLEVAAGEYNFPILSLDCSAWEDMWKPSVVSQVWRKKAILALREEDRNMRVFYPCFILGHLASCLQHVFLFGRPRCCPALAWCRPLKPPQWRLCAPSEWQTVHARYMEPSPSLEPQHSPTATTSLSLLPIRYTETNPHKPGRQLLWMTFNVWSLIRKTRERRDKGFQSPDCRLVSVCGGRTAASIAAMAAPPSPPPRDYLLSFFFLITVGLMSCERG